MTISVVRNGAASYSATTNASLTALWDVGGTADAGNALLLIASCEQIVPGKSVVLPAGWTELYRPVPDIVIARKVSDGTETGATITFAGPSNEPVSDNNACLAIVEVSGTYHSIGTSIGSGGNPHTIPSVTPPAGVEAMLLWLQFNVPVYGVTSSPLGYTNLDDVNGAGKVMSWWKHIATTSGSYSGSVDYAGAIDFVYGHIALTELATAPEAEFDWSTDSLTVFFSDESNFAPTSWLWDFGDGNTSTSQNPTHIFASGGTYAVTLTATNAFGSDDVTHSVLVADIVLPELGAGRATVEIYVHDPSGARWDEANWDEAVWATSGWVDVTPESLDVEIRWGVSDASLGILSIPDAATWAVNFLDPDRKLDPSNPDSPFFGDLVPFLPVRVNHNGTTIKTGVAERLAWAWNARRALGQGNIRVTDNIARMANAKVPHDTTLGNTLYARAVDALSAAGLGDIVVLPPLADDPGVVAWVDPGDGSDRSVWDWITDAAQGILWQPYIDERNQLGFRDYAAPLFRGKDVTDADLVNLVVVSYFAANYSVVESTEDGVTYQRRELTPKPAYGARVYRRDDPVLDASAWSQAVLEDRSLSSLRWVPGEAFPTTPERTRDLALIQPVEQIGITNLNTDPVVAVDGIVLGGTIRLQAKYAEDAQWWIGYEVAQTAELPLADSVSDPPEFLEATGGGQFLYPSV